MTPRSRTLHAANTVLAGIALTVVGGMAWFAFQRNHNWRALQPPPKIREIARLRNEATTAMREHRFADAERAYQGVLHIRPSSATQTLLAGLYEDEGKVDSALALYRSRFGSSPTQGPTHVSDPPALVRYADLALREGHKDEARRAYAAVAANDRWGGFAPHASAEVCAGESLDQLRSIAYLQAGLTVGPTAVPLLRKALEVNPKNWTAYEMLAGGIRSRHGSELEPLMRRFRAAVDQSGDPVGRAAYGRALSGTGHPEEALAYYRSEIERTKPVERVPLMMAYAQSLVHLQRSNEALAYIDRAQMNAPKEERMALLMVSRNLHEEVHFWAEVKRRQTAFGHPFGAGGMPGVPPPR